MAAPPYIIYYRVLEDQKVVQILTIRHGSRRQPRRFR
jgi:plasmid stabilization system protein ParE